MICGLGFINGEVPASGYGPFVVSLPRRLAVGSRLLGGIRQYSPPKCIVLRLRSVRHVHISLLRNARIWDSSVAVTKSL